MAIVVYPMNALINSQYEEFDRYKKNYGLLFSVNFDPKKNYYHDVFLYLFVRELAKIDVGSGNTCSFIYTS